MTATTPRVPPFDPELSAVLTAIADQIPPTLAPEMIESMRLAQVSAPIEELLDGRGVTHIERTIPGPAGAPDLTVSIFGREDRAPGGPAIYHTHGGGMIMGDRFIGVDTILAWVEQFDALAVSVEYRLAPEHQDPALIDDCYAGLAWTAARSDELGFDPDRLFIAGGSAGGGLAAGVALMARDKGGPKLAGQILMCPMLDDRNETVSSQQINEIGVWDRGSNDTGWDAYLGDRRKTAAVSIYAAPARARNLSNLPPAIIDVGTAEVFRDEAVAYASGIWAAGGIAELHVWPGGFHGFEGFAPAASVSVAARETRTDAVRRLLRP